MKRFWLLLLAPLALTGCAGSNSPNSILGNAGRSFLTARAYDRAVVAARREDTRGSETAQRDLENLLLTGNSALRGSLAQTLVLQASRLDSQAQTESDATQKADLLRQSADKYRRAQRVSGAFGSEDPQLLNALGYFLADRGTTPNDFKEAERLTRQSVRRFDALLRDAQSSSAQPGVVSELQGSRANVRDSLAWALFKQKRYPEASREQDAALKEFRAAVGSQRARLADNEADLVFHLAEIQRALGQTVKARDNYREALRLKPGHADAKRALKALSNL